MTYILDLIYKLGLVAQLYLLNTILLGICLVNMLVIIKLYQFKKIKGIDYKIHYFMLNNLCIFVYVGVFLVFILIIRYIRWGYSLDLKEYYNKVVLFILKVSLLISCNIVLMLIICMLLWLLFKKFLHKEIIKRHLYIYYTSRYNTAKKYCEKYPGQIAPCKDHSLYVIWSDKLGAYWSTQDVEERLVYESFTLPYDILFEPQNHKKIKKIINALEFLLKRGPLILLIFFIFHDCIYNHFQIQLVFYYMPLYFAYHLWENISSWLKHTDKSLNMIIYDLYYMEPLKYYVGMTSQEKEFIDTYLQQGLRDFKHDIPVKTMDDLDIKYKQVEALIYFVENIKENCIYGQIDNTDLYKNYSTGDVITKKQIEEYKKNDHAS